MRVQYKTYLNALREVYAVMINVHLLILQNNPLEFFKNIMFIKG